MGDLSLTSLSDEATVLIVRDPDGDWLCDGGAPDRAPQVALTRGLTGSYRIWVGTEVETSRAPDAELVVAAIDEGEGEGDTAPGIVHLPAPIPAPAEDEAEEDDAASAPAPANPAASIERGLEQD
jgi:hypothetical protein